MLETIKCIELQKKQVIKDVRTAIVKEKSRGLPNVCVEKCTNCNQCKNICPTSAIGDDLSIDMGKCIFCGECQRVCGSDVIKFSTFHKIGSTSYENLITKGKINPIKSTEFIKKNFWSFIKTQTGFSRRL